MQREDYRGPKTLLHAGKVSAATSVALIVVLLLATPSVSGLLLAQRQQPVHAAETNRNTFMTASIDSSVIAGLIAPVVIHSIHGLDRPSIAPITRQVMPFNSPVVAPADIGSIVSVSPAPAVAAPNAVANFEGLHTTVDCTVPPDSDGAVGPWYFVAFVNNFNNCATQTPSGNVGFYCKAASGGACTSQGTLAAAFYYPNLFSSLTTTCNSKTAHSDPQVVYDSAKDRYLFADIATTSPFQICVAATLSNDPINGAYCVASYASIGSNFPDYEKVGVWLDGFYVGYNPGGDSRTVAVNKDDLEACMPSVRTQDFDMGSDTHEGDNQCTPQPNHIFRPIPATYNIFTGVPAAGEPEFIVATYCLTSHVYVFTLHVDWSNSANSVLTRALIGVQTDAFAPSTVSSPGNPLDTLRVHLMTPAPYFRDSSGNEYLWTTKTVRGSSTSLSAIAWYQFKVVNNAPGSTTVKNQNIWNPDSTSRLQAAAAFDRQGNILMDYSQVSSSTDPAVAYAGRLANDTANTLGQAEAILFRGPSMGSGACGQQNPCTRWGDYSSNFIDPDGCTFWFTHEYYPGSDVWQWATRIGATKYSGCTPLTYGRTVTPASLTFNSSVGVTSAAQNVTVTNTGTGPLVVQVPNINGTNAADFKVSSDNCSTAIAGIAAGTSCTVRLTCTPSASGTRTASLNIKTNVAAADSTSVLLSCTVSGSLTGPTISTVPSTIDSGQSSTLSTTASFSGGTSPYACQWLQKAPATSSYSNLGSAFTCTPGDKPTTSTGTLSTTGTWSFELQVTDNTPTTMASNPVNVTVSGALTVNTPSASPSTIDSGQSSTLSDSFISGTSPYTCQWLQKSPGAGSYTNLGSSSSCVSPISSSTGILSATGAWSFELQVTDSSGSPVKVTSSPVTVTVNTRTTTTLVTPNPSSVTVGNTITYSVTVTDTDSGASSTPTGTATWSDNGAGGSFSSAMCTLAAGSCSIIYTPTTPGSETITASYGGDSVHAGGNGSAVLTVIPPLSISFKVSPSVPAAQFKTNFTATATGGTGGYSFAWSFGDNGSGAGQVASHIYALNGTYTVTLTVTDSSGTHAQATTQVKIVQNPDVDGDRVVDIVDVANVAFVYGSIAGDAKYNPRLDLNSDGRIDIFDIAIVAFYYGKTVGS